ncbi:MAG: uroporphyrinogen-III synthase, partial [Rhodospirillales bacterium]|nr:uroporphyrinogen-III synthase [Rhodospirillales bacterium]
MPVPEPRPARPRTVLVTRPEPAAGETARRLAAMGFVPILTPALAVRRRAARLPAPGELQAILVTSANAIPALPASHHGVMLL